MVNSKKIELQFEICSNFYYSMSYITWLLYLYWGHEKGWWNRWYTNSEHLEKIILMSFETKNKNRAKIQKEALFWKWTRKHYGPEKICLFES
jgi:hypothetical protein